ncbi:ABC transporter substrate-binding protein [Actinomadura montaniterrae]|nr:ABC transporter substrate-binding protein [Actinomadura montaniterrae]
MDVRLIADPTTLDPQSASNVGSLGVANYLYDTPVALREGKIVPSVASSWKVATTSIEMTIRKDVTCSDGSKLTVKDVADSIKRLKSPTVTSRMNVFGNVKDFTVAADEAASTVSVKVSQPYGDLLQGMSQMFIICRKGLDDPSSLAKTTDGTGPYRLAQSVPGDHYTLERRAGYTWGPGAAAGGSVKPPAKLVLHVIADDATAVNSFETGGLDLTDAQGQTATRLKNSPNATQKKTSQVDNYTMYLNEGSGRVTSDVNLRRALFAGLDRASLATSVIGPGATVPKTLVLPRGLCYQPDKVGTAMPAYDLNAARRYAEAGGYTSSGGKLMKDGKQVSITVLIPSLFGPNIADFLISSWGKLGVAVKPVVKPGADTVRIVSTPKSDWDVYVAGGFNNSPSQLLATFGSQAPPQGRNNGSVHNAEFLKRADKASAQITTSACDDWSAAEQALYEQADIIPWGAVNVTWFGHDVQFSPYLLSAVYPDGLGFKK